MAQGNARRIIRATLAFLVACLLLVLLLAVALHTPPGRRYVLRTVSGALRARGIDFHASALQYNLFTLQGTLDDVVIGAAAEPRLPPVATISRVRVRAQWGDLFRGALAVEQATVERPAIHVVIDRDGRDNVPRIQGGGGGGTTGFFLGRLTARDGTLRVEDLRRKLDLTLPWRLDVAGRRESGAYSLHLAAGPGAPIRFDGREIPIDAVRLDAVLRGSTLDIGRLAVDSPHTVMFATGSLAPIGDPRANLAIRLRIDAARWARILRLAPLARGEVRAELTASGPLAGLRVAGTVGSTSLVVERIGPVTARARIRLDAAARRLALDSVNVSLLGGSVTAAGSVALTAAAGTSHVALGFNSRDVSRLCREFGLPVVIASRAEGSADARWPGLDVSSANWTADLVLASGRREAAAGVAPVAGSLKATSQGGRTRLHLRGVEAMATRWMGDVTVGPAEKLEGTLRADVAKLSDLLRSLAAYQGKTPPSEDRPLEGRAEAIATLGGTLGAPEVRAHLSATDLSGGAPARPLPDVDGDVTVRGTQARMAVRIPALTLTANVQMGLRAPYPAELTVHAPAIELAALPVAVPAGLQGEASASLVARGNLNAWQDGTADARVERARVRWKGLPVEIREPIDLQYRARALSVSGTVHANDSFLTLQGALPLGGETPGDVQVRGRWDLGAWLALLPEAERPQAAGRLDVTGHIRGTLQRLDPALDVTLENASIDDRRLRSPVNGLTLQAQLRGAALELASLSANWAGATLTGSGRLPLAWLPVDLSSVLPARREPATASVKLDGLNLRAIRGVPETVRGTVSLEARAEATEPALDAVRATVTIPRLDVAAGTLSFRETAPGTITMANGVARIAAWALEGPGTTVRAEGTADFRSPHPLDLKLTVKSRAGVIASFVPSVTASGPVELDVSVKGTPANPEMTGYLLATNARVGLESPPVLAEDLNVRIDVQGDRASIARFDGTVNGGRMNVTGGLRYADGRPQDVEIKARATGVAMEYPAGLKTLSDADVALTSDAETLTLGGTVTVVEGSYQKTLSLEQDLLPYAIGQRATPAPTGEGRAWLDRLRFNVAIATRSPVVMANNLGELAATANLRLTGGYENPGLLGRLTIEQGGTLRLNERTYTIDRGTVTFTSPQAIEATPDIVAKRQAAGYDITLHVTKQAGQIRTDLTSDPALSESNIVSVLLTGRTLEEARGATAAVAQRQALSYLAGKLGQAVSSRAQSGLGLTTVRLETSLISAESAPGARLTVAQDVTPRLNLSYSVNLTDSGDQIWAAQYDLARRFSARAVKQSDNSYRFEIRDRLSFGGERLFPEAAGAAARPRVIGAVQFSGSPYFTPDRLADRVKLKAGDKYDFFKVQKGVNRLQDLYAKQDFLESRIRTSRTFQDSRVDLDFRVNAGPKVEFAFEGWSPPGGTRREVRAAWRNGAFAEQRAARAVAALRDALARQGYVEANVSPETPRAVAGDEKSVGFRIQPGPRFHDLRLEFPGANQIAASELEGVLKSEKLTTAVYLQPSRVTEALTSYYHEHGYLAATVGQPRHQLDRNTGTGQAVIPVTEGPKFRVGRVTFEGNASYSTGEVAARAGVRPGDAYLPERQQAAADRLRDFYLNNGFSDVTVQAISRRNRSAGIVDLEFRIDERKQRVVQQIEISGTRDTSPSLVRKQMTLAPGDVLGNDKLGQSLARLYATGAYSDVDIEPQKLPAAGGLAANQEPVRLLVKVREVPPWDLSFGAYYDTDRGPGGVADLSNHSLLGGARTVGTRVRYDDLFREARVYLSQPPVHRYFPKADLAAYWNRDQRDAFVTTRLGLTFQQEVALGRRYVLTYGYRIERATTRGLDPTDTSLDSEQRLAPLTASLTRETRDDVLDATHGMFLSNALEVGTKYLGSDARFVRYLGQYFQYVPLSRPAEVPFSRAPRPRFVWASGIRVGLDGGLAGQVVQPSQRFFAGGGSTIRGFGQDQVGPKDSLGQPVGGNAVFILNQEIRFPIFRIVDGAAFVDVGNVYPTIRDFNPFDVRSSAGFGLRVRTPVVLLRLDYGIKLDRKAGEGLGAIFFSIGQAF